MKFKQKFIASILALGLVVSNIFISNADTKEQQLEVHFINVGQGDATYIEMPNGDDILIDAGKSNYGDDVVNYLKGQEANIDIEYLIATHPDADHVGGMQEVFKSLNIKNFYYPMDAPHNTQTWKNVLNLANAEGCNIMDAKTGDYIDAGGTIVQFVQPHIDYSDNNDDSVVTLIDYNNTEVLVTGDISASTEDDMIKLGLVKDIDVLKVAHHGSSTSSSQEFLEKAKAEEAVISVGKDNSYGHPHSSTVNRLTSIGSRIWRTDLNGNIVMTSDGNNIIVNGNPSDGQTQNNWVNENGNWYYYINGIKQTNWIQDEGKWYYLNSAGIMQTGWQQVNGAWYFLDVSGVMATNWLLDGGQWYYLGNSGAMETGWTQVGNSWYYMLPNGVMATGWQAINGSWYFLNGSGVMLTGWQAIDGSWYFLDGSGVMLTGWQVINGSWYFLNGSGVMLTGWQAIDGSWYFLDGSGVMLTGWLNSNGTWYYLNDNGVMATGWNWLGKSSSYVNDYGITITETTYNWYYFYNSGEMATYTTIDGWYIDGNGIATPEYGNDDSWEDDSLEPQETVYITPGGKSYHNSRNCTALKRSPTILEVSYSEAINKGKSDPCNLCVRQ